MSPGNTLTAVGRMASCASCAFFDLVLKMRGSSARPALPVQLHDDIANLADGLLRQIDRVGAHVGDQADLALADVDAFIKLLRDAHGASAR